MDTELDAIDSRFFSVQPVLTCIDMKRSLATSAWSAFKFYVFPQKQNSKFLTLVISLPD